MEKSNIQNSEMGKETMIFLTCTVASSIGTYHEQCFLMFFFTSSSAEIKPHMFIFLALKIPAIPESKPHETAAKT